VELADMRPGPEAFGLSATTGKLAEIVQLIFDNSTEHFLATERGPITARHTLGYQVTCAGIDRDGADAAWLPC
jgi:coenzyme F420-0:L-glutamate ligase / coenzyme F420-1:gamma-L-glutamate ligase